jgi:acetylornithine/N-succinyldiaminopimelate aminotransferase
MEQLSGGVGVVTGAASGIGRAVAEALAREGMRVVLADIEAAALDCAVAELRGAGLLLGIRCVVPAAEVVTKLRQSGLLTLTAGENVLRILPPLIVGEREIDDALDIMNKVAREWPA